MRIMPEITNLNILLQNNPYGPVIIPIINYFNDPKTRPSNPFSALAAASLLRNRQSYWNDGTPPSPQRLNFRWCCADCGCRYVVSTVPCPTPLCGGDNITSQATGEISLYQLLVNAASAVNLDNPWTPNIRTFETQLAGINMNAANAWVFFQQAVDVFFANTDILNPLQGYLQGDYSTLFNDLMGGNFRTGYKQNGLLISTVSDGISSGTKAVTTIVVDVALIGDIGTYYEIYSAPLTRFIIWHDVDLSGAGAPAVPGIGGVTDIYLKVDLDSALSPSDLATLYSNQLALAVGWGFEAPVTAGVSDVIITTLSTGVKPASVNAGPVHDSWAMGFVNGTTVASGEITKVDYDNAIITSLAGTWFKLYAAANNGILFYYQTPAQIIDPAVFGIPYTTAVPIIMNRVIKNDDCETCYVEAITTDAILNTGLFTAIGKDGCCNENPPCADPPAICSPRYQVIAAGDFPDAEGGTAALGAAYQVNDVIAPDGTIFGSAEDDLEYARIWNNKVVPHMANLRRPTHYLKPVIIYPCICCIQSLDCPAGSCIYIDCGTMPTDLMLGSLMLQTSYPSITKDLKFNAPGSSGLFKKDERCKTCLI